jgi:hypothetical protein
VRCAFGRGCRDPEDCTFCEGRAEFAAEDRHHYDPQAELDAADREAGMRR